MIVRISEIDPICAMQACMDGYEVVSPYLDGRNDGSAESIDRQLLAQTDLVVTATGNMDVCDHHMLRGAQMRRRGVQHRPLRPRDRHRLHAPQLGMGGSETAGAHDLPQPRHRATT